MKIRVRPFRRAREGVSLNLASMIDLTFLLLIYFLVTTLIVSLEDRLSPALQTIAEKTAGPAADFQPQVVEVFRHPDGRGAFRVGPTEYRDRPALTAALERLHRASGIFVRATDDAPVAAVASAIQATRDARFEQVTYVPAANP